MKKQNQFLAPLKHTQGKWCLMDNQGEREIRIWDDKEGMKSRVIAFVSTECRGKKEYTANAKLVASAPELLEMLRVVNELLKTELLFSEDREVIRNAFRQKIESVIDKATK